LCVECVRNRLRLCGGLCLRGRGLSDLHARFCQEPALALARAVDPIVPMAARCRVEARLRSALLSRTRGAAGTEEQRDGGREQMKGIDMKTRSMRHPIFPLVCPDGASRDSRPRSHLVI